MNTLFFKKKYHEVFETIRREELVQKAKTQAIQLIIAFIRYKNNKIQEKDESLMVKYNSEKENFKIFKSISDNCSINNLQLMLLKITSRMEKNFVDINLEINRILLFEKLIHSKINFYKSLINQLSIFQQSHMK